MTVVLWPTCGMFLTVVLLARRQQNYGASLALLPGALLGPFVLVFIIIRLCFAKEIKPTEE